MLLGALGLAAGWQFKGTQGITNNYDKKMFYSDLNKLGEKIINGDSIIHIKSGEYNPH